MKELIKITEQNGKQAVSARELHCFLESKRDFSNWIKDRIEKYGFNEGEDFEVFNKFGENPNGGRPLTEYALSIDCAKEIAMVEGNEKGKQARRYFIECEKKLKEFKPLSQLEILAQSAQMLLEQDKRIGNLEKEVQHIVARTKTTPDYYTVVGYATLNSIECPIKLASSLGRKASTLCKKRSIPIENIPDPRFGMVNTYPYDVLDEIFNGSII